MASGATAASVTYSRLECIGDIANYMLNCGGGVNQMWGGRMPTAPTQAQIDRFLAARAVMARYEQSINSLMTHLRGLSVTSGSSGPYARSCTQINDLARQLSEVLVALSRDLIYLNSSPSRIAIAANRATFMAEIAKKTSFDLFKKRLTNLRTIGCAINEFFRGGQTITDESRIVDPSILRAVSGPMSISAGCAVSGAVGLPSICGRIQAGGKRRRTGRKATKRRRSGRGRFAQRGTRRH